MELVRFYALIVKIALMLAVLGLFKTCTLELLGKAGERTGQGMISYSRYTRMLTK